MRFVPNNSGVISQFQVDGWPKMCCWYPNTLAHQCSKFTLVEVHYRKSLTRTLDTIYYKASCPLIITCCVSSEQPPDQLQLVLRYICLPFTRATFGRPNLPEVFPLRSYLFKVYSRVVCPQICLKWKNLKGVPACVKPRAFKRLPWASSTIPSPVISRPLHLGGFTARIFFSFFPAARHNVTISLQCLSREIPLQNVQIMGTYVKLINATTDILFFGFLNANCIQTFGKKTVPKKKFGMIFMKPSVGRGCFLS